MLLFKWLCVIGILERLLIIVNQKFDTNKLKEKKMKASKKTTKISETVEGKAKALQHALDNIHKQFGVESLRRLGSSNVVECETISTGSISLDAATGIGGIPKGRIVEFYGPESSGKTTLALQSIACAQKDGGVAAFIDAEHALDPNYARNLGVNLDELLVSQPDSGEQALEIAELLTRSGGVDLIVIDSVAALTPQAEIDGEMGDSHVGLQARLMSQGLRKLTGIVKKTNTTVLFINQIRMKIGVMFGSPETTTGGNALKFYASLRLDIRRCGSKKNGDDIIGNEIKVKVVKNKMAAPFKVANFEILFSKGINRDGEIIDIGIDQGVISKSGSWISYGKTRLGQGREKAVAFINTDPELKAELENLINEKLYSNIEDDLSLSKNNDKDVEDAA